MEERNEQDGNKKKTINPTCQLKYSLKFYCRIFIDNLMMDETPIITSILAKLMISKLVNSTNLQSCFCGS